MASMANLDFVRCFGLVFVSLVIAPLSTSFAFCGFMVHRVSQLWKSTSKSTKPKRLDNASRRTILVTGIGMAKGLTLARAFYLAGHRVIGADFEVGIIPCSGKYSRSISKFYRLSSPDTESGGTAYTQRLLSIIKNENVDLWVSCSGVASAIEDAQAKEDVERRTSCRCIQFDCVTTSKLHEKNTFIHETKRLKLTSPETFNVTSQDEILKSLKESALTRPVRHFILKPVGVDDAHRANMTLLPLSTEEATNLHISRLPIAKSKPWIMQQFISGGEEYCTHSLVVRGEVKSFVACPSAELLMHYKALPFDSALSKAMLAFTREFIARSTNAESMTGHLSFDFMVEDSIANEHGVQRTMYAIECNPRAHTAVTLFSGYRDIAEDVTAAYLTACEPKTKKQLMPSVKQADMFKQPIAAMVGTLPRYWIGHDLICLVLHPFTRLVMGKLSVKSFVHNLSRFFVHVFTWKEGTFEFWDPMPALVLYHIYWPMTILLAWWQGRSWSRINVSTTKMFAR